MDGFPFKENSMYVTKKERTILNELSAITDKRWRVGQRAEYPVLICEDLDGTFLVITEGGVEVKQRIQMLAKEYAIHI